MDIKFKVYECEVAFDQYCNGKTAIQLIGKKGTKWEGERVAVASVNGLYEVPNEVVGIKNWSENKGMADALINANVIEDELLFIEPTGFVHIEYYKLTDQALKLLKKFKVGQQA